MASFVTAYSITAAMFFTKNDGYALRLGATQDELKEIIYLTTVTAGFPRSIDAAQALREVFATSSQNLSSAQ
jgi:4-carboxymuconolactone decarboxylase